MKKAILILLAGASFLTAIPAAQAYSPTRKKTLITALTALSFIGYSTYYLYGTHEVPTLNQYSLNDAANIVDEEWGRAIDTMCRVNEKLDAASFAQNLNKPIKAAEYYFEAAQLTEGIADTYRNSIERMLLLQLDAEQTLGENKDFRKALLMGCAIACKSYDSAAQM
ncbi:MAG TPA: hypothetical protein DIU37_00440, partial [Opitutae bacterium]|nr:hypothetical protein [Opitutae bacterium]